jgi:hypothetical protein
MFVQTTERLPVHRPLFIKVTQSRRLFFSAGDIIVYYLIQDFVLIRQGEQVGVPQDIGASFVATPERAIIVNVTKQILELMKLSKCIPGGDCWQPLR